MIADILATAGHAYVFVTGDELPADYDGGAGDAVLIGIGDNFRRERVASIVQGANYGRAIHPSAIIARTVMIGEGAVVMPGAVINAGVKVGAHTIINTNSSVDHDCVIEDFASIAPGVALGGNVQVGRGTAVGIGASVAHGCEIGEHTVIGAGATVVQSLPGYSVCYGVPARVVRQREADEKYV